MQINATSPEAIPNVKTILGHEMALELIELKKSFLASVFSQFQPAFDDVGLYQTPDNGWQVNFRHDQNCETRDNAGWNYAAGTMPLVNGRMGSLDGLSRTNSYAEATIESHFFIW